MTPEPSSLHRPVVLLVAPRAVRRAMLDGFLASWAHANGVSTLAVAAAPRGLAETWQMAVVDLGAFAVDDDGPMDCVRALRQCAPDLPIAVLSDNDDARSAAVAIRLGLRAYVPTDMPTHLALGALTLVLKGGDYFPPTALLERTARQRATGEFVPGEIATFGLQVRGG